MPTKNRLDDVLGTHAGEGSVMVRVIVPSFASAKIQFCRVVPFRGSDATCQVPFSIIAANVAFFPISCFNLPFVSSMLVCSLKTLFLVASSRANSTRVV